jgi:hypothetical protein
MTASFLGRILKGASPSLLYVAAHKLEQNFFLAVYATTSALHRKQLMVDIFLLILLTMFK